MSKHVYLKLFVVLVTLVSQFAFAHGGGPGGDNAEKQQKTAPAQRPISMRKVATAPEAMNPSDIAPILSGSSIPADVAPIRCSLGEFSECRGLAVVLKDFDGHEIASTNTGTDGLLAFEGLKPNVAYIAAITSERYSGEVRITGGKVWALNAERR